MPMSSSMQDLSGLSCFLSRPPFYFFHLSGRSLSGFFDAGHNVMRRSVLQPQLYADFSNALSQALPCNDISSQLFKGDVTSSTSSALNEWDSSKMLLGSGQAYGGTIGSELFGAAPPPPPPLLNGSDVSAGDNNAFAGSYRKSTAATLQHCSSSVPKSSMTSASMAGAQCHNSGLASGSVDDAILEAHHKMMKVANARLRQQHHQQHQSPVRRSAFTSTTNGACAGSSLGTPATTTTSSPSISFSAPCSLPSPRAFNFSLPASPNKNKQLSPPRNFAASPLTSSAASFANHTSLASSGGAAAPSMGEFSFKHPLASANNSFNLSPSAHGSSAFAASSSVTSPARAISNLMASTQSTTQASNGSGQHQVKLNPDFIRAAAALQKAISQQNQQQAGHSVPTIPFQAFQQQQQQQQGHHPLVPPPPHHAGVAPNHILNYNQPYPSKYTNLEACKQFEVCCPSRF